MSDLPQFKSVNVEKAQSYIKDVLGHGDDTPVLSISAQQGGYFRVIFAQRYFVLAEGQTVPSKSQWNTLKKRMKRVEKQVFVLKEHGQTPDGNLYLDFGFFKDES
jgi:hypothetical protein